LSTDDFEFSSNVKGGELLFQYWDKLNPPLDVQVLFDLNLEFSDGNFKIFHKADFLKSVNTYFDNQLIKDRIIGYCFHPSAQSDVFRWIQMFSEGGIYLDADMKLLDNSFFYKIKNKNLHFIPWADELQFPCISNWLIKLPAGNKLLSHTLNYIDKFLADDPNIKDSLTMFDITGPGILTHAFVQSYLSGDYSPNFNLVTETSLHAYFSYGSGLDYKKDPDCYWPLLSGTNFKYVDGRLSLMHRI
jgi:hypothetical protein